MNPNTRLRSGPSSPAFSPTAIAYSGTRGPTRAAVNVNRWPHLRGRVHVGVCACKDVGRHHVCHSLDPYRPPPPSTHSLMSHWTQAPLYLVISVRW